MISLIGGSYIRHVDNMSSTHLASLASVFPRLTRISLRACTKLQSADLSALAPLSNLRCLEMPKNFDDHAMQVYFASFELLLFYNIFIRFL